MQLNQADIVNYIDPSIECYDIWEGIVFTWDKEISIEEIESKRKEVEKFYEKEQKLTQIKDEFDFKMTDYLSQYKISHWNYNFVESYNDMVVFYPEKRKKAETVLNWWEDEYISKKAQSLWITNLQCAQMIIKRTNEFETKYTELEAWKDNEIQKLENNNI